MTPPDKGKLKPGEQQNIMSALAIFSHIGLTMMISVALGVFAGIFIDNRLGTGPVFLLVLTLLGVVSGFWSVYKIIIKTMK